MSSITRSNSSIEKGSDFSQVNYDDKEYNYKLTPIGENKYRISVTGPDKKTFQISLIKKGNKLPKVDELNLLIGLSIKIIRLAGESINSSQFVVITEWNDSYTVALLNKNIFLGFNKHLDQIANNQDYIGKG